MSSLCASLALYASSQFRPAQGIALDNRVAILTPAVGIAALGASGPPKAQVATAFAAIGISAVMSGLTFWQAGRLRLRRLRRLLRMFPYPVAAELLASSGLPLAHSAFVILTGARSHALIGTELAEPTVAWGVVAAAATAVALGLLLHAGADGGLGL